MSKEVVLRYKPFNERGPRYDTVLTDHFWVKSSDYDEALAQIAALTVQVEDLERGRKLDYAVANKELSRVLVDEAKIDLLEAGNDHWKEIYESLKEEHAETEAELTALREGATVMYRVDRVMVGGVEQDWTYSTVSGARNSYDDVKSWPDNKIVTLREIITREHILDTTEGGSNAF